MDIEHDEVLGNDNLDGENGVFLSFIKHVQSKYIQKTSQTRIVSRDRERSLAYEDGEAFGGESFRVVDLDDVQDGAQEVRDGMDSLNDELNSCGLK